MATVIVITVLFLIAFTIYALNFARANPLVWFAIVVGWGMLLGSAMSYIREYAHAAWVALAGA